VTVRQAASGFQVLRDCAILQSTLSSVVCLLRDTEVEAGHFRRSRSRYLGALSTANGCSQLNLRSGSSQSLDFRSGNQVRNHQ
jgi:hypothetical protein